MPKLKTRKGVLKRVKLTKKRKIKFYKTGKGHILTKKRSKRKRQLRRPGIASSSDQKILRSLMPYGS